jgi:2-polyprenyl-3-methyl-5-hydroxy-6-metoxy-1,4-benzoquinol methylase
VPGNCSPVDAGALRKVIFRPWSRWCCRKTRDGYDRWAEVYDGEGNPLVELEEPEVDGSLGDVHALEVLDVGCGTGVSAPCS